MLRGATAEEIRTSHIWRVAARFRGREQYDFSSGERMVARVCGDIKNGELVELIQHGGLTMACSERLAVLAAVTSPVGLLESEYLLYRAVRPITEAEEAIWRLTGSFT